MTRRSEAGAGTLPGLLVARAARTPDAPSQWALDGDAGWRATTWAGWLAAMEATAAGLRARGLMPGQRVAMIAGAGVAWDQLHFGVLAARGVVAGIDGHAGADAIRDQLRLAAPAVIVVDDVAAARRLLALAPPGVVLVVVLTDAAAGELDGGVPVCSFEELVSRAPDPSPAPAEAVRADDPAWLVFTSGTTGQAKALVYRHAQISLAVDAILETFDDIGEGARLVSWLPLANPFQRIINTCAVARGAQTYYVADPRSVMTHLPAIRPQLFVGVPRFFEKYHQAATRQLDAAGPVARWAGRWAIGVGRRHAACLREGRRAPGTLRVAHRMADALVLRRLRAPFGGGLRRLVSGSAPMPIWLLEWLDGVGLPVFEAYGLSECIVPVACNRPGRRRLGSVGQAMPGNRIRLAADGELMLASAGVAAGYIGASADEVLDVRDGWLATGDHARLDDEGYIWLQGRKSEVFKTSTGRRIAPAPIEALLRAVPGVEHAVVFGAGRATPLAIVCVDRAAPAPVAGLAAALRRALEPLPAFQRPAAALVTDDAFTIESGELTPNLKLRRHEVARRRARAVAALAAWVDSPVEPTGRPAAARTADGAEMIRL